MNKINILLVFLLTFGLSFSQDELSQEEKERRQKNIEAGNPFAKFGYKAKVATLSNGKYLEFHDLDTIVTIGSIRFHVDKMQIVGLIERDSLNPDAQPIGDATGRWISVDPLSEEFPEWSPYTMSYNNPIRFVDPDGRSAKDIVVTAKDGTQLFTLDDGKKEITTMTVQQLYKKKIQWFEPHADNYMPIKSVSEGASSDKLKHFSKEDIENFSNVDRWMISYRNEGSGDWKLSEEGADGYLLVTVDNMPYWADAIGQIPFAVDKVTDEIDDGKSRNDAINITINVGKKYGEGKLIGGKTDNSNTYDNYFILRGALFGANKRDIMKPITLEESKLLEQ